MRIFLLKQSVPVILFCLLLFTVSCAPIEETQSPLLQNWEGHFIIGEVPSDWEEIKPESGRNCVKSWKKGDVRVHMYIYEMMETSFVLNEVSRGMTIASEPRLESVTNYAMSIDGVRNNIFTRYVAIPSETGKSTFAFAYFQRIPGKEVHTVNDLLLVIEDMPELEVFHQFISEFQVITS